MAEGLSQRRAVTTGGRLEPIKRDKVYPRPKTHYPFITRIQVKIKKEDVDDGGTKSDTGQTSQQNTPRVLRPTNYTYKEPPVESRLGSRKTFYEEEEEEARFVQRRESLEERHRERRKALGERASASYLRNNTSLYRPRFTAKDCDVQLLLVRELTEHLHDVGREFRRSRRVRRLPAFHSRATKGEQVFGNRIRDASEFETYSNTTAGNSLSTRTLPFKNG